MLHAYYTDAVKLSVCGYRGSRLFLFLKKNVSIYMSIYIHVRKRTTESVNDDLSSTLTAIYILAITLLAYGACVH